MISSLQTERRFVHELNSILDKKSELNSVVDQLKKNSQTELSDLYDYV